MKKFPAILLTVQFVLMISHELYSQSDPGLHEFGITPGGFTNFPANQDYLKEDISVFYIAPYIRTGQHEFSAGIVYPLSTHALYFNDGNISPRLGAMAGYKFYIFNVYGRENLFVHYTLQYLRFKGDFDMTYMQRNQSYGWTETDMYINNVIGLGYNLFFDINRRFGLYYTLDYVISQAGYKLGSQGFNGNSWHTQYIWNNLSTNFGLIFKITSLKKNDKK
jgi:hypothetical protein